MRYLIAAALALFAVIGYVSNTSQAAQCVTEDQPGTCVWEGHVRTYVDDVNVVRA